MGHFVGAAARQSSLAALSLHGSNQNQVRLGLHMDRAVPGASAYASILEFSRVAEGCQCCAWSADDVKSSRTKLETNAPESRVQGHCCGGVGYRSIYLPSHCADTRVCSVDARRGGRRERCGRSDPNCIPAITPRTSL
ncbi:hypothetical protein PHLGIDRAFT_214684 [Phlebiopsis gigantea 11061_1 CR5-6]|uniref:Uncharacterized protein n=1 Tax=Phlebiopsis gigantea (strain 11061_1 CR5-6) TaxID=745531 RepID=A0A0C3S2Q5_PHLG1|nr:hypothetical protein PHLGIDRAFT_214684 [Phlebiopsis gigantea 11061_1 CR5-6]